jgi:hypothetical protein
LDGARSFSFEADDLLSLHFRISEHGLTDTALNARLTPGFLRSPGGGEDQPDYQCHHTRSFDHAGTPPSRSDGIPPE